MFVLYSLDWLFFVLVLYGTIANDNSVIISYDGTTV